MPIPQNREKGMGTGGVQTSRIPADSIISEISLSISLSSNTMCKEKISLVDLKRPIVERMAKERKLGAQNNDSGRADRVKIPQLDKGKTREIIAKEIGISPSTYDIGATLQNIAAKKMQTARAHAC